MAKRLSTAEKGREAAEEALKGAQRAGANAAYEKVLSERRRLELQFNEERKAMQAQLSAVQKQANAREKALVLSAKQAVSTSEVAKLQQALEERSSRVLAAERRAEGLQRKLQLERVSRTQAEVRADVQAAARERVALAAPPLEIIATERGRCDKQIDFLPCCFSAAWSRLHLTFGACVSLVCHLCGALSVGLVYDSRRSRRRRQMLAPAAPVVAGWWWSQCFPQGWLHGSRTACSISNQRPLSLHTTDPPTTTTTTSSSKGRGRVACLVG